MKCLQLASKTRCSVSRSWSLKTQDLTYSKTARMNAGHLCPGLNASA